MLMIGPMPVPPATNSSGRLGSRRKKRPNGPATDIDAPRAGGRCNHWLMAPSFSSRTRKTAWLLPGSFTNE